MRLCLISKYPPLEGGTSRSNQGLARALVAAGHDVHVVTNAAEAKWHERTGRCQSTPASSSDNSSGSITVHQTEPLDPQLRYIPWAEPHITKLASLATEVIAANQCELILGRYMEPYGVAASLAANWMGQPYGIGHAGSDVALLLNHRGLRTAYGHVVRGASYVLTTIEAAVHFIELGVPIERLYPMVAAPLHDAFSPESKSFGTQRLQQLVESHYQALSARGIKVDLPAPELFAAPHIGVYGKLAESKGLANLLKALSRLRAMGDDYVFLAMLQGPESKISQFVEAAGALEVLSRVVLVPFVPHELVPQFIRTCIAVCVLEEESIVSEMHRPSLPKEVISCGTALILSRHVRDLQPRPDLFESGNNSWVVDARDAVQISDVLHVAVSDTAGTRDVGLRGHRELAPQYHLGVLGAVDIAALFETILGTVMPSRIVPTAIPTETIPDLDEWVSGFRALIEARRAFSL